MFVSSGNNYFICFLIISLVAIPIETQEDLNAAIAMTLDVSIRYDELGWLVQKNGIHIRHGKPEIQLRGGKLIIDCELMAQNSFVKFINKKCELNIPFLSERAISYIQRTGILTSFSKVGLMLVLIDLGFVFIGSIIEHGSRTFWEIYFPSGIVEFCEIHPFMLPVVPIMILGLVLGMPNKRRVRKELDKFKIFRI